MEAKPYSNKELRAWFDEKNPFLPPGDGNEFVSRIIASLKHVFQENGRLRLKRQNQRLAMKQLQRAHRALLYEYGKTRERIGVMETRVIQTINLALNTPAFAKGGEPENPPEARAR